MGRDIDQVIRLVKARLPRVVVAQLKVANTADDGGVWWFSVPGVKFTIQVESTSGTCPFLIETDEQSAAEALRAETVARAVQLVTEYLSAVAEGRSIRLAGERFWEEKPNHEQK